MIFVLFAGVFLAATVLTGAMRRHALRRNMIDIPNDRSSHTVPTPTGGGMSIVVGTLAGLLLLWALGLISVLAMLGLLLGGVVVAGIGYLDDRNDIPASRRLLVHFAAAALLVACVGSLPPLPILGAELPLGLVGSVLAVPIVVWGLNLYNFMDGIDGIAGVEAVTVFAGAALLLFMAGEGQWALVAGLYAAASLGFLPWNWPPARIFMGDGGSGFLGFSVGALMLYTFVDAGFPVWSWLILLGVFIVDATFTLLHRMIRGERWYEAHCDHAYQHAARELGSHLPVSLATGFINLLWLLPLAWAAMLHPEWGVLLLAVAWLPLLLLALRFRAGFPERAA